MREFMLLTMVVWKCKGVFYQYLLFHLICVTYGANVAVLSFVTAIAERKSLSG